MTDAAGLPGPGREGAQAVSSPEVPERSNPRGGAGKRIGASPRLGPASYAAAGSPKLYPTPWRLKM